MEWLNSWIIADVRETYLQYGDYASLEGSARYSPLLRAGKKCAANRLGCVSYRLFDIINFNTLGFYSTAIVFIIEYYVW